MMLPLYMFESLRPKLVQMEVRKGATLESCKEEAVRYSMSQRCDVEFTFNGKVYITGYEVLLDAVKESM